MAHWLRVGLCLLGISLSYAKGDLADNFLQMDLESLAQVKVSDHSTTLIGIDQKYIPSTVTTITQEDIQNSGARSLDELLEIYVPDLAYMFKLDGNQIGIGGIISDRNNKILLTLNGKVINIKGRDGGAVAERWFSMLGDIAEIEVISGAGSVIYGPGAIAGVINIRTLNADSFQGFSSSLSLGYGEKFGSIALKYGTKFANEMGLFLYAGIDRYSGVAKTDMVNKFAFDYPKRDITAYQNYPHPTVNLNGAYASQIRGKYYLELNGENFSLWSRYVKGGLAIPTYQYFYIFSKPEYLLHTGSENEQWSNSFTYWQQYGDLQIEYGLSYIRSELEKRNRYRSDTGILQPKMQNEESLDLKTLATYEANLDTTYALGVEYSYNRFLHYQNDFIPFFNTPRSWQTGLFSLYGELYHTQGAWETVVDMRWDKHTYTENLFSYRVAEVYKIANDKTLKANYSHSVRHMDEIDMYRQVKEIGNRPDSESIDRFEVIYNYDTTQWHNSLRLNYNLHDIVAYNGDKDRTTAIGKAKFYTIEGKIDYQQEEYGLSLSHAYTSLVDFETSDAILRQNISASAYGYGSDFANWHNHITKLRFWYAYDRSLQLMGSLRLFWGIPGAIDMADYNRETFKGQVGYYRLPVYQGDTKAFDPNFYLNLSLRYRLNRETTLYLHGYNLLGLFDKDLNKRNYFQTTSNYLDEAPALSVTLEYTF